MLAAKVEAYTDEFSEYRRILLDFSERRNLPIDHRQSKIDNSPIVNQKSAIDNRTFPEYYASAKNGSAGGSAYEFTT